MVRYLFIAGILSAVFWPSAASAMDLWSLNGHCKEGSHVKRGSPYIDMHNIRGAAIDCDLATITEMDNGRKLIQFVKLHGRVLSPGFAGSEFKYTEGHYSLVVDRLYPERAVAGKVTAVPANDGYCFFSDSDFSKLTEISCVAVTENSNTKIIYRIVFQIDDISVKRNLQGLNEDTPPTAAPRQSTGDRTFDRIFEYTMFNQTLPDGKHPLWIYYQSGDKIARVDMPSLDICAVTPGSSG